MVCYIYLILLFGSRIRTEKLRKKNHFGRCILYEATNMNGAYCDVLRYFRQVISHPDKLNFFVSPLNQIDIFGIMFRAQCSILGLK